MKLDADRKAKLLFAAVLVAGMLALGAWALFDSLGYATYQIETHDPVSGLVVDAPVEFHGVEVGHVKRIELAGPSDVRVLLAVSDRAPINASTVATITSRGLATRGFTGYVYVALENEGTDAKPLVAAQGAPYAVIPTTASKVVNLDMAIAQVNRNVERLSGMLERQVLPQMQKTMTHADSFLVKLNDDPGILIRGVFHRPKKTEQARAEK
jgi:phospholipid/cholesterol/gamma-HCH transport system substrate-binding protein